MRAVRALVLVAMLAAGVSCDRGGASVGQPPANPPAASEVPRRASIVSTKPNDRRLYVQRALADGTLAAEAAFVVRGVAWAPVSAGDDPTSNTGIFQQRYADAAARDIPLMQQAGVNVVRVYHDFGGGAAATAVLDALYRAGIWAIVELGSPRHGVVGDAGNINAVVNAYKDHPALLMWSFGNEWDVFGFDAGATTLAATARRVNQAALAIKAIDRNHPVTTFIGDLHIPAGVPTRFVHPLDPATAPFDAGPFTSELVTTLAPDIDVWSTNIYRGQSFGDVFAQWRRISQEPLLIGEFGIDRYDHRTSGVNASMQAAALGHLLNELHFELSAERVNGTAVGGIVFEFQDEHWKNGSPASQQTSNETNPGQPDGFNDEEYFGLLPINRSTANALGYDEVRRRFTRGAAAASLNPAPVIRLRSGAAAELEIDGRMIFSRMGGGGGARGFNVFVIDRNTGTRIADSVHFDTWWFRNSATRFDQLIAYLRSQPAGTILAISIADHGGVGADAASAALRAELAGYGATRFGSVDFSSDRYAIVFIKGGAVLGEQFVNDDGDNATIEVATVAVTLSLTPNEAAGRR